MELAALECLKIKFLQVFWSILIQIFLILADKHNILCLNLGLITVSSSELPAFEYSKVWCLQTLCWLSGEGSLSIWLLVPNYI